MKKHYRSFTYEPKTQAVLDGRCCHTIRPRHTVKAGDVIQFHNWLGRPYWSAWGWRIDVKVVNVEYVYMFKEGLLLPDPPPSSYMHHFREWKYLTRLATRDHISPPTGVALGELMNAKHKLSEYHDDFKGGKESQIITWKWPPLWRNAEALEVCKVA